MKYFHGSKDELDLGVLLKSSENSGYTSYEECISIEEAFESLRPSSKYPRLSSVYLAENINDIENLGGYDDFIYEVLPSERPQKSDLRWYSMVASEMGDFFEIEELSKKAKKYISNYWEGVISDRPLIEYRVPEATVKTHFNPTDVYKEEKTFKRRIKP